MDAGVLACGEHLAQRGEGEEIGLLEGDRAIGALAVRGAHAGGRYLFVAVAVGLELGEAGQRRLLGIGEAVAVAIVQKRALGSRLTDSDRRPGGQ